jgi:hypothetical protein
LLFCCAARLATQPVEARPIFERLFRGDGLPGAIRTADGAPFATPACCGLSKRSVGWITLGSRHQRSDPGRPEQHGRNARLHRTLKADATRPPAPHQRAQQARVDRFCRADNAERPHAALHCRTPASCYQPAARPLPAKLPAPAYPGHSLGRRVSQAGTFRFQPRQLLIRATRLQEDIAWEETADGLGSTSCYGVLLARLAERNFKLST